MGTFFRICMLCQDTHFKLKSTVFPSTHLGHPDNAASFSIKLFLEYKKSPFQCFVVFRASTQFTSIFTNEICSLIQTP